MFTSNMPLLSLVDALPVLPTRASGGMKNGGHLVCRPASLGRRAFCLEAVVYYTQGKHIH